MARELARLQLTVYCPVERRAVDFVLIHLDDSPDLIWCRGCHRVTETDGGDELRCPKSGDPRPDH